VKTVSTPLARSRCAMSRPACMVWVGAVSVAIPAAYPRSSGTFADRMIDEAPS
jgi:hypothetical protein